MRPLVPGILKLLSANWKRLRTYLACSFPMIAASSSAGRTSALSPKKSTICIFAGTAPFLYRSVVMAGRVENAAVSTVLRKKR